jgi:hypothetical protein
VNDPDGLLSFHVAAETLPRGLQLVAGLTGFIDSGSTVEQFSDYFTDTLDGHIVAEFRADDLLDYRARRPTIYFDQDHISGYETPKLAIYLLSDDLNRPFYFMTGFEPDFRWEAFARTVRWFIETFEVEATTWVHAIPMPAPHTRPIGVTVSGNRRDLADSMSVWRPNTQAPANAMHIVEYSLDQANHGVVGFVLLVPHYLGDAEYPSAAVVALQSITAATGLIFPTDFGMRVARLSRRLMSRCNPTRSLQLLSDVSKRPTTSTCKTTASHHRSPLKTDRFHQQIQSRPSLKSFSQLSVVERVITTSYNPVRVVNRRRQTVQE